MHAWTYVHTAVLPRRLPFFQTVTVEEHLLQRQLSLISLYLRHLFLGYFFSPLSLHTFFFSSFAHSPVLLFLCFPPFRFLTFAFVCSTNLPGRFSTKESDAFFLLNLYYYFMFILRFWRVHFLWNVASKDPYHRSFCVQRAQIWIQPPPNPSDSSSGSQPHWLLLHFS